MRRPGTLRAFSSLYSCMRYAAHTLHSISSRSRARSAATRTSWPPHASTNVNPRPCPQRDWSAFYSPGHEIQAHLQEVVDKYKLMRYIKLSHEVVHAQWDAPLGQWRVRVRRTDTQEEIEDVADVLVTAFGAITRWKMPDIPGLGEFKGELHHTAGYKPALGATWESDLERWKDKRVGVVGSVRPFSTLCLYSEKRGRAC